MDVAIGGAGVGNYFGEIVRAEGSGALAAAARHCTQHTVRSKPVVDVDPELVAPGVHAVPLGAEISA